MKRHRPETVTREDSGKARFQNDGVQSGEKDPGYSFPRTGFPIWFLSLKIVRFYLLWNSPVIPFYFV